MREGVESILVVRIRSDCDLQMMNSFLRIPKNDQVPAQKKLRIRIAGLQRYQMIKEFDGALNIADLFFSQIGRASCRERV